MSQTASNATGTWVVVGWEKDEGPAGAQVVSECQDRETAEAVAGEMATYGDQSLTYLAMSASRAAMLGLE